MDATDKLIAVFSAIIGVTIIAVIISKKSATSDVIRAASSGFGGILGVAVSPVTGTAVPQLASSPSGPSNQGSFTPNANPVSSLIGGLNTIAPIVNLATPIIGGIGV